MIIVECKFPREIRRISILKANQGLLSLFFGKLRQVITSTVNEYKLLTPLQINVNWK